MNQTKYHNKKVVIDGITFHSQKEARRYSELKLLEKAGVISNLELQPKFELQEKFTSSSGEKIRAINYIADFKYIDHAKKGIVIEDVKGMRTKDFELKMKMFLCKYPQYHFILT